jgi:hypothetical protein
LVGNLHGSEHISRTQRDTTGVFDARDETWVTAMEKLSEEKILRNARARVVPEE